MRDTRYQDEVRQAWKQWQDENPEHAQHIRDTFADIAISQGWAKAEKYLANVILDKLTGVMGLSFCHAEILNTVREGTDR